MLIIYELKGSYTLPVTCGWALCFEFPRKHRILTRDQNLFLRGNFIKWLVSFLVILMLPFFLVNVKTSISLGLFINFSPKIGMPKMKFLVGLQARTKYIVYRSMKLCGLTISNLPVRSLKTAFLCKIRTKALLPCFQGV